VILALVLLAQFLSPLVAFSLGALAPLLCDALVLTREQVGSFTALLYARTALACLPALWAGWPQVFTGLGGSLLASALGALLLYREPPSALRQTYPLAARGSLRAVWGNRQLWRLVGMGCLYEGVQDTFTTYLALFLQEHWGLSLPLAGSLLAQAQPAAAASRVPYGWVSDRWIHGRRQPLLRGLGAVTVGALLALLVLPHGTAYPFLPLIVMLFGLSGLSWGGTYITLASELAGEHG
jgi:nitrate/nitrite transporter NarK